MNPDLIDTWIETDAQAFNARMRELGKARRQVSVKWDDDTATISSPKIGDRNPANPQPTDPTEIAERKVA